MTRGAASATALAPAAGEPEPMQVFRLYVRSASPASSRAVVNARHFLDAHLPGRHRLTVLEISQHIEWARADQIVALPTLIRLSPAPLRRFVGDMSDTERLRRFLGVNANTAAG